MIYQLVTGKIIYITIDQFLALSDDELNALSTQNIGEYARSPWIGSAIRNTKKREAKEDQEEHDSSIDYSEENDELSGEKPTLNSEEPMQDLPETPEENQID